MTKIEPTPKDSLVLDKIRYQRSAVVQPLAAQLGSSLSQQNSAPFESGRGRPRSGTWKTWVVPCALYAGRTSAKTQSLYRRASMITFVEPSTFPSECFQRVRLSTPAAFREHPDSSDSEQRRAMIDSSGTSIFERP